MLSEKADGCPVREEVNDYCSCPKTECENHGICCKCMLSHKNRIEVPIEIRFPHCLRDLVKEALGGKRDTGMIELKRSHLRMLVNNFRECFLFYRDVLELPVRYGDEHADYAEFKTDALHVALFRRKRMAEVVGRAAHPPDIAVQDRVALILRVADTVKTFERLREKGVVFVTDPIDRPDWHCRTAHFRDPDGNLIELNSDL